MKRNELMAIIATCFLMFAVCLSASAQNNNPPTRPSFGNGSRPNVGIYYEIYPLDDASFSKLYNKVKKASFDDTKYDLLEVACLGCYFSCQQAVRLMKIFTFDDERMKVLRMVAPRIVDPQNAHCIHKIFTFDSDKQKVKEIMRNCRQNGL